MTCLTKHTDQTVNIKTLFVGGLSNDSGSSSTITVAIGVIVGVVVAVVVAFVVVAVVIVVVVVVVMRRSRRKFATPTNRKSSFINYDDL